MGYMAIIQYKSYFYIHSDKNIHIKVNIKGKNQAIYQKVSNLKKQKDKNVWLYLDNSQDDVMKGFQFISTFEIHELADKI